MTLSKTQREVLELMRDGRGLHHSSWECHLMGSDYLYVRELTFRALLANKFIENRSTIKTRFDITPLGLKALKEER